MKVYNALKSKNIDSVIPLFGERNKELDAAFYYEPGTMEGKLRKSLIDAATDSDAELVEIAPEYLFFYIYDNGKLTSLMREGGKPAIVQNFIKAVGSRSYDLIFRYQNGNWILTR